MVQAALGGEPSKQAQLRAYLRGQLADTGPLDFDSPGGLDTSWRRIFLALRCGYHSEAIQVSFHWLACAQAMAFSNHTPKVLGQAPPAGAASSWPCAAGTTARPAR